MQRASTGAALDLDRLDSGNPESSPPPQFSPLPVVAETPAVAAAGGVDHAADIRSTLTLWRSLFQALADESIFLCVVPSVRFPFAHDVPGLTRLLLNAKAASAANAERRAAAAPPPSKRLEAKPGVFVADSSGNVAAPAPQAEPAPPKSEIISDLKRRKAVRHGAEFIGSFGQRRRAPQLFGVGEATTITSGSTRLAQWSAVGTAGAAQLSRFQALRSSPVSPSTSGLPKAM